MPKPSRPKFLLPISLALAWIFDFLFWEKPIGISFPIFGALVVATGLWLSYRSRQTPARNSLLLLIPIAFFLIVSVTRAEPLTLFLSRVSSFFLITVLALTLLGGRWPQYSFTDYFAKLLLLVPNGLGLLRSTAPEGVSMKKSAWSSIAPVARGVFLALPILFVLGSLLASADQIFSHWLTDVFEILNLEDLGEYAFRTFYIVILAYLIAAGFLVALFKSKKETVQSEQGLLKPFLGFGESATILACVNLLFAAFVVVQLRYFFAGQANISIEGFTYAEYARRGFAELVVVAMFSLGLFLSLSTIAKRTKGAQQKWFSWLGIALMLLVSVILVSAYQRLLLYESVYGFTRLRTYAHVFMVWLGLLLAAVVLLELVQRRRAVVFATLMAALSFVATLALLNVDAFIVRANFARANFGEQVASTGRFSDSPVDILYLASLSADAMAGFETAYTRAIEQGEMGLAAQITGAAACHATINDGFPQARPWQSWHFSRLVASNAWSRILADLQFAVFEVRVVSHDVTVNGVDIGCEKIQGDLWD